MGAKAEEAQWDETGLAWPVDEQEVKDLTSKEASKVIEVLLGHGLGGPRRYSSDELAAVGVRAILHQEVLRSLQDDVIQDRIACEGGCSGDCDKSECTCGGECTCGKRAASLVVTQAQPNSSATTYEDPVIALILNELLV
jgi:hypothetical protein